MAVEQEHLGILLTRDLIFSIKIMGTARAIQRHVVAVDDVERAEELCRLQPPDCILIDLTMSELDIAETVERLRVAAGDDVPTIAFGPHVDRQRLAAASEAGCREVYPRSQFSSHLTTVLRRYLAVSEQEPAEEMPEEQPSSELA